MRSTHWGIAGCLLGGLTLLAQPPAQLDRATQARLQELTRRLSDAQRAEDELAVRELAGAAVAVLGEQAGLPEVADEFRPVPQGAHGLQPDEIATAFDPAVPYIERQRWWRIGLDPTQTNHALREVATVIEGCVAAAEASPLQADKLLSLARDGGDFLVWTQSQAETGIYPFPAVRDGDGRPFEVAERFLRRAEAGGRLEELIRNGWVVADFDDGGLQFDHGLAGVALLHLYEATRDERYRESALRGADWVVGRRVVTNWNYNSFSVYLLAEAYRVSRDERYLAAAKLKTRLGLLPGQLSSGPRAGRWADPHNARPAYHYIMVRALAALAAVLPEQDADRPAIVESLRLALLARNPDFDRGICNADSAVEALLVVHTLPSDIQQPLQDCRTEFALQTLERYAADRFRRGNPALSPGAWGQLLRHAARRPAP